jgi:hypothetical protein
MNKDIVKEVEKLTDRISKQYSSIMNPKKRPGKGSTLTYLDNPGGGFEQIQLLEARLKALEMHGEDYLSERDKRNGFSPHSVKRMVLCQILSMYKSRRDLVIEKGEIGMTQHENLSGYTPAEVKKYLFEKMQQTNQRINEMDAEQINPPIEGDKQNEQPPGGDAEKLKKTLDAILEIRKAREAIVGQLSEIRTQAKSKISALKSAEDALLDQCEGVDQMELFKIDPSISPEAQEIIENPII